MTLWDPFRNDPAGGRQRGDGGGAGRSTGRGSPGETRKGSGASLRSPSRSCHRARNQTPFSHSVGVQELQAVDVWGDKKGTREAPGLLSISHPSPYRAGRFFLPPGLTRSPAGNLGPHVTLVLSLGAWATPWARGGPNAHLRTCPARSRSSWPARGARRTQMRGGSRGSAAEFGGVRVARRCGRRSPHPALPRRGAVRTRTVMLRRRQRRRQVRGTVCPKLDEPATPHRSPRSQDRSLWLGLFPNPSARPGRKKTLKPFKGTLGSY